ncbi:MAG: aromatic amino acid transport family protein [bacterium]|nr:aromatic amino acid transport family protein [bacterium]
MSKNYLLAIATLMGTIIGVGLFAIPYITAVSGVLPLIFYIIILAVIQNYLHLLYAEIVLSTRGSHRLPGYMEKYNGRPGKLITLIVTVLSDYGAMLAYIIVGGLFLHQLLAPIFGGSLIMYASALFFFEALIVLFGIRLIAGTEFIMTGLLILIIALIGWKGLDFIKPENYTLINWRNVFLPYGPIFFAISGMAAIPDVCKLMAREKNKIKSVIAWGTYLSAFLVLVFALIITGITGAGTTPDTLTGLGLIFGDGIIKISLLFGLLAVVTSMICIAQASREVFWWDFKFNKNLAWALACFAPFLIYLAGVRDITKVVSLTGALAGGILGVVVIYLIGRVKKKCELKPAVSCGLNKLAGLGLSLLFVLGLIYEVWTVFK